MFRVMTVIPVGGINSTHEMTKHQTLFYEDVNNFKLKYNFVREMLIEAPFKLQYKLKKLKSRRIFQESETELFRNKRRNFSYNPCLYLLTDANKRNGKEIESCCCKSR